VRIRQQNTSRRVATLAGTVLANPKAGKKAKELAASALAQACGRGSKIR
jgi:hypothetical protein